MTAAIALDTPGQTRSERSTAGIVLSVSDLSVLYNREPAVEAVSFDVRAGERVAIIGPNGAGKSTLIKTIIGLLQPQSGSITMAGDPACRPGYVPQHEDVDWGFPATAAEVVLMGCVRQMGWFRWPGRKEWRLVEQALHRVGIADLGNRQIGELSGGQRRRVFIARALVQEANILLLDEPFSGVDASAQSSLLDVLDGLNHDGITIILSTHDLGLAFSRFDRVLALRRRMIAFGAPESIYQPEVLAQLYEEQVATVLDGRLVFVDDHHCC